MARGALVLLLHCLVGCHAGLRDADRVRLLWPEGAPRARGDAPRDRPRLYYFLPAPRERTGVAIVVASGGSYGHHGGLTREGVDVAKWLAAHGIVAVVLRYRVAGPWSRYDHVDFHADGERAIRTLRAEADALGIDPERIGMLGFSAGGHLASSVATRCAGDRGRARAPDPIERQSCAIAFTGLVYPVITLDPRWAHRRSRRNLLGDDASRWRELSTETRVDVHTPPAFIVHSLRDRKVDAKNSELYHAALVHHGVQSELCLFPDGRHGVGLATDRARMPAMSTWPARFLAWLDRQVGARTIRERGSATKAPHLRHVAGSRTIASTGPMPSM